MEKQQNQQKHKNIKTHYELKPIGWNYTPNNSQHQDCYVHVYRIVGNPMGNPELSLHSWNRII